jgi:enterochelin esterase-like enzyme
MNLRRSVRLMMLGCLLAHATVALGAAKPTSRKAIELDVAKLELAVGQYQLEPYQVLSISRFRDRLFTKTKGQHPYAIFPSSETVFFYMDEDAQITILKDADGKVTGVQYDEGKGAERIHKSGKKISSVAFEPAEAPEIFDSPRLAALAKEIDGAGSGDGKALEKFWKEVQDHAPLVEPFATDARSLWVTFLYRGDNKTRTVSVWGGPWADSSDGRGMNLTRLRQTDLWYRSVRMPSDARIVYAYSVNLSCRLPDDSAARQKLYDSGVSGDPLNPKFIEATGSMEPVYSVLELPDAPPQPYIHAAAGIPHGKFTDHKFKSGILNQRRSYSIYTPPGYDSEGAPCPLVVMFDGNAYHTDSCIPGPTIIDNLIAAKKIPPVVVAFVDQNERQKELNCSEEFAAFIAKELVPRLRAEEHTSADAKQTTVGGLSSGGLMASYCALHHPDVFGNVISQSGAYWIYPGAFDKPPARNEHGGTLVNEYLKTSKVAVRFYLEAGRFENMLPSSLLAENQRFRDVLLAKGYDVTYSEFSGGHHYISWRGSFADALIAVTK